MATPKPESVAETRFVTYVKKELNLECLKLRIDGRDGFPDRSVLCNDGRIIFFEFKRVGHESRLRPQQRQWRKRLEQLGFEYHVVSSAEQAQLHLTNFIAGK
jgi:hypothetical protein